MCLLLYLLFLLPWSDNLDQFCSFGESKHIRLFEHKQMKRTSNEHRRPEDKP